MTSILSDTFAPPRIATNGRSGDAERVAEVAGPPSPSGSRRPACGSSLVIASTDACARWLDAERVVHVRVAERRELRARTPGRSSPPRGGSAGSRAARRARRRPRRVHRRAAPPARCSRRRTPPAGRAARPGARRPAAGVYSRFTFPLGRPRCEARMTVAPVVERVAGWWAATRGCACRRVIWPSLIGTLKSTRTKTRLPRQIEILDGELRARSTSSEVCDGIGDAGGSGARIRDSGAKHPALHPRTPPPDPGRPSERYSPFLAISEQVDAAARVAPLVVVPREDLHEVAVHHLRVGRVERSTSAGCPGSRSTPAAPSRTRGCPSARRRPPP